MSFKLSCVVYILVLLINGCYQSLTSPCPAVFTYENSDGQWCGIITLPSAGIGRIMKLNVTLSVKNKLPSPYTGHIQLVGDRSEVFVNILYELNIKYKVILPALLGEVPAVTSVVFNKKIYCEGPPASASAIEIKLSHAINTGIDSVEDEDSNEEIIHVTGDHTFNKSDKKDDQTPHNRNRLTDTSKPVKKYSIYPIRSSVFITETVEKNTTPKNLADIDEGIVFEPSAQPHNSNRPNGPIFESFSETTTPKLDRFLNREYLFVSDALPEKPVSQHSNEQTWDNKYDEKPKYPNIPQENDSEINKKSGIANTTPKYVDQNDDVIVFDYDPPRAEMPYNVDVRDLSDTYHPQHRDVTVAPLNFDERLNIRQDSKRPNTDESIEDAKLLEELLFPD